MDELELLKKDWQKQDGSFPKLTYSEIYSMLLRKSSSIVKWIFIIGLLEFAFLIGLSLVMNASGVHYDIEGIEKDTVFIILTILSYIIPLYFFYRFYINYKTINTTDSAKNLMENILKTRRTVKQYVYFNLALLVIGIIYIMPHALKEDENMAKLFETAQANGELFKYYASIAFATFIALAIGIGFLLLFYWLIYGILLKRLKRNYNELKQLEA